MGSSPIERGRFSRSSGTAEMRKKIPGSNRARLVLTRPCIAQTPGSSWQSDRLLSVFLPISIIYASRGVQKRPQNRNPTPTEREPSDGWTCHPMPAPTHPSHHRPLVVVVLVSPIDRSIDRWGGSVTDLLLPHEKWQAIFESGRRSLHATAHGTYHYSFVERGFT